MKDRAKQIDLSMDDLPSVKTLGEVWSASSDQFSFSAAPLAEDLSFDKNEVLEQKLNTIWLYGICNTVCG